MVRIRPMQDADVEAVVANHMEGWRVGYRGIIADEVLDGLEARSWITRYRDDLARRTAGEWLWQTLIAVDELDVPQGHVTFGPWREQPEGVDPQIGEILSIYVHPSRYGQGFGAALMSAALAELPQREVRLWVLEGNARARRFYEKAGLRPDGVRDVWTPRGTTYRYPELRYSVLR